jgi:hypothetical protein
VVVVVVVLLRWFAKGAFGVQAGRIVSEEKEFAALLAGRYW